MELYLKAIVEEFALENDLSVWAYDEPLSNSIRFIIRKNEDKSLTADGFLEYENVYKEEKIIELLECMLEKINGGK